MAVKTRRVRVTDIKDMKRGEKIAMLTAYDASFARLLEAAGIEILLVGDSLGMVVMGEDTTIPVTLDAMIHHTRAVTHGVKRALVVADMPFLSYQASVAEAVHSARRLIQEGGAAAVKMEGGRPVVDAVRRLGEVGIPVMGHLGLTPQSVHRLGGFGRQARHEEDAEQLVQDARLLDDAGVFAIVLESIPDTVARRVTETVSAPTIGIGAGPHCDGQVLVCYDAFGLLPDFVPPFVKQYANVGEQIIQAARQYAAEVKDGNFPVPR